MNLNIHKNEVAVRITMLSLKLILTLFVLGTAGGCAQRAMNYTVASWQNQQLSAVVAAWGKPSEELKIEGKHLLLWNTYDGELALPDTKRPTPRSDTRYCVRLLKADKTGKIIDGTWDGNDCPGWFAGWYR